MHTLAQKNAFRKQHQPVSHTERPEDPEHNDEMDDDIAIEEDDAGIMDPFDPTKIKIETKQQSLDSLIKRLKEGEIQLSPDFQRNEVWKPAAKSQLIESLLIRIPLPAFYMDATDEDKWLVVDGLQRLSTLRDFVVEGTLILENLEFLKDLEGKTFKDLPRNYQRRIEETQVTLYLIEKGTPPDVKFNIFKRINTGGLPLSPQEIRHALNQGPATLFLRALADSVEFRTATPTNIRDGRMSDRALILRFAAFTMTGHAQYTEGNFDTFLNKTMAALNETSDRQRQEMQTRFKRAMLGAHTMFDKYAFRKPSLSRPRINPLNKALFEAWSVNLGNLTESQMTVLLTRTETVNASFLALMQNQDFFKAITQGTSKPNSVKTRFEMIEKLIHTILQDAQETS